MKYTPVLFIFLGCVLLPVSLLWLNLGYGTDWTAVAQTLAVFSVEIGFLGVIVYVVAEWLRR